MSKMLISLDEQSWSWLEAQAGDADAYINALIHQDQQRKAEAKLRNMLENARQSGIASRAPTQIIMDVQAELKLSGRL